MNTQKCGHQTLHCCKKCGRCFACCEGHRRIQAAAKDGGCAVDEFEKKPGRKVK